MATINPEELAKRIKRVKSDGSWYEFFAAKDDDTTEVLIYDSISWYGLSAKKFVDDLKGITSKNIKLRINSPGGSVFDGLAIYNALRAHPARVTTRIEGVAASIASVIALAGDHVTAADASFVMIHNPWGMAIGNAQDMRDTADVLDKLGNTIAEIYARKTGDSVAEMLEKMSDETWYSGSEALEAGLIDEVYDTEEIAAAACFDFSGFCNLPEPLQVEPQPNVVPIDPRDDGDEPIVDDTDPDTGSEHIRALMERRIRLHVAECS